MKFNSPEAWLEHCRAIVRNDLDVVILLSGDPGSGKSNLMLQIIRHLDPAVTLDRVHFTVRGFIDDAKTLPKYSAVAADELLMHKRKSMHGESIEFVDFMQINRGLNLFQILCFPHAMDLDKAILHHRVRYRVDIDKPKTPEQTYRLAHVYEREIRSIINASHEEDYVISWVKVLSFKFYKNKGKFAEDYLAKKILMARMRDAEARGKTLEEATEEDLPPKIRHTKKRQPGRAGVQLRVRPTSPLYHAPKDEIPDA